MPEGFKFFKVFFDIFLILVPLEIPSQYADIDSSHWRRENSQLIMDKVFREYPMVLMASTLSSRIFYRIFGFCLYFMFFP